MKEAAKTGAVYSVGTFGRLVGWIGLAASLVVLAYGIATHGPARSSTQTLLLTYGLPLLSLAISVVLLRLSGDRGDTLGLALVATVFSLYLAEGGLWLLESAADPNKEICSATKDGLDAIATRNCVLALGEGRDFDTRSRLAVIEEMEASGQEAVPSVHTRHMAPSRAHWPFMPLGGVSNTLTVYCNETGEHITYVSDEYGFRNPPGLQDARADVALIGDSFTQGSCVHDDATIAGVVRKAVPATLNLGSNGNGPLMELATIKEYLSDPAPQTVFWMFYEGNDLDNLDKAKQATELLAYLEPGYSQGIRSRQPEVDARWHDYVEALRQEAVAQREVAQLQAGIAPPGLDWGERGVKPLLLLRRLRDLVAAAMSPHTGIQHPDNWDLLTQVMTEAKREVGSWGGELVVVYLPTWSRFGEQEAEQAPRTRLLEFFDGLGLPTIDATETFAAQEDPLVLWPFRQPGHYTPEGYRLVADLLLDYLGSTTALGSATASIH